MRQHRLRPFGKRGEGSPSIVAADQVIMPPDTHCPNWLLRSLQLHNAQHIHSESCQVMPESTHGRTTNNPSFAGKCPPPDSTPSVSGVPHRPTHASAGVADRCAPIGDHPEGSPDIRRQFHRPIALSDDTNAPAIDQRSHWLPLARSNNSRVACRFPWSANSTSLRTASSWNCGDTGTTNRPKSKNTNPTTNNAMKQNLTGALFAFTSLIPALCLPISPNVLSILPRLN